MEHRAYKQRSEIRSQRSESTNLIVFLKSEIRNSKLSPCCLLSSEFLPGMEKKKILEESSI
jgi:hypothetical protein